MWQDYYRDVTANGVSKGQRPLPLGEECYVIVEAMGNDPEYDATRFEQSIASAIEQGLVGDAVIA